MFQHKLDSALSWSVSHTPLYSRSAFWTMARQTHIAGGWKMGEHDAEAHEMLRKQQKVPPSQLERRLTPPQPR